MKRICIIIITLLTFFFLTGNCLALNFTSLDVVSDNRAEDWYFEADLLVDPPANSYAGSVSFDFDTQDSFTYPLTYLEFFSLAVYDAGKLNGDPASYGGKRVTWTVSNGSETISATGTVPIICPNPPYCFNPIRQVELSTDFSVTGDPLHPTISWKNMDEQIQYYKIRLLDGSNRFLWQSPNLLYTDPEYGANPTYTVPAYDPINPAKGYDLQPGVEYIFRIEAREQWWFPVTGTGLDPLPTFSTSNHYADLINRSTSFFTYTTPGPEPEIALVDLHPDVFEVKTGHSESDSRPERNFIFAYIVLPEGLSESEVDTITLSMGANSMAKEVSRDIIGNVLHVRFPLETGLLSEILGLPVTGIHVHEDTIKVRALKHPAEPIGLLELTVSDGSSFAGTTVVRIMLDKE
jgi:hypothetical protein